MLDTFSLIGGALVALLTIVVASAIRAIRIERRRRRLLDSIRGPVRPKVKLRLLPFGRLLNWLGARAQRLMPKSVRTRSFIQLERSGFHATHALGDLALLELTLFILTVLVISSALAVDNALFILFSLTTGFLVVLSPRIFLYYRARYRLSKMTYELPNVVDLMMLVVSGGLGLTSAIQKVVENQSGILVSELSRTLEDLRLGISKIDAFAAFAKRNNSKEITRFANAIMKVDQLGVSLTLVLSAQSQEIRHKRILSARERAQRVTVKILFPLILCFLPGMFIVVIGPAVIDIIAALQGP